MSIEMRHISTLDAERAVLGSILLNPDALDLARPILGEDGAAFKSVEHKTIFEAMMRTASATGVKVDVITLYKELSQCGDLETAGGGAYLADIAGAVPTSANVENYARAVKEMHTKRRLYVLGRNVMLKTQNGIEADDIIADLKQALDGLDSATGTDLQPEDVGLWLTTKPPEMKYVFDGLMPLGTIVGLLAAGGVGKSYASLTLQLSAAIGRPLFKSFVPSEPMRVLSFSSEEPAVELHRRTSKIADFYELTDTERAQAGTNMRLFTKSLPLVSPHDGTVIPTKNYRWLSDEVAKFQPRFIVIDPQVHFYGGDENSNVEIAQFMSLLHELTGLVEGGASILVAHHVSKQRENEVSSAVGRGASASRDAQRIVIKMSPLEKWEIEKFGISNMHLFTKMDLVKANWTEGLNSSIYFQRCTGVNGGVLHEVDMAKRAEEIEHAVLDQLAQSIADAIEGNADNWSAHEISKGKQCKDLRQNLKDHFGRRATQEFIRKAIDHGERTGMLVIEKDTSNRSPRYIPRKNYGTSGIDENTETGSF